jgi:hypothetical protein
MGELVANCSSCVGPVNEACSAYFNDHIATVALVHMMETEEQGRVLADPTLPDEQKVAIREAGELESVHLANYHAEVLAGELAGIGCKLSSEEVKNKMVANVVAS